MCICIPAGLPAPPGRSAAFCLLITSYGVIYGYGLLLRGATACREPFTRGSALVFYFKCFALNWFCRGVARRFLEACT